MPPTRRLLLLALTAVLGAGAGILAGAGLVGADDPATAPTGPVTDPTSTSSTTSPAPSPPATSTTTTNPSPTTPTTTPPSPTTTAPPAAPAPGPTAETDDADAEAHAGTLRPGDHGPRVLALQHRLRELGYWLGDPDGDYGELTEQAVLAFQKAEGLQRDGIAGGATRAALAVAGRPVASQPRIDGIEIDLDRQLLLVVAAGEVRWAINTSTGAAGWETRPGTFAIDREIDGIRRAPLGNLYRPKYFDGGIAIHGSPDIPAHAASHGCARVTDAAMDLLWSSGIASVGTEVRVY